LQVNPKTFAVEVLIKVESWVFFMVPKAYWDLITANAFLVITSDMNLFTRNYQNTKHSWESLLAKLQPLLGIR